MISQPIGQLYTTIHSQNARQRTEKYMQLFQVHYQSRPEISPGPFNPVQQVDQVNIYIAR